MSKPLAFTSNRNFLMFSYNIDRGLLLHRSKKEKATPTRLDILFQDVRAMELRCWFNGLTIEEAGVTFLKDFRSNPIEMIEPGNKICAIKGQDWLGFIVGGIVLFGEDDCELFAPSGLIAEK